MLGRNDRGIASVENFRGDGKRKIADILFESRPHFRL
jgi:hypothetical protein